MKITPFRKTFTINLKRVLHAWGTLDMSMGYTWPVKKSWVACIARCSCDILCKVGTCWLPLHFFHILITLYRCMAKQIWWLPNIQRNQCSMLKFMLYHTNIMCLQAHNKPKNAHRLQLFCTAFQYNRSSFTLFRLA